MKRTYLITLLLAFMTFGAFAQPKIIAHRGASYLAPENTVAAANLAWELGTNAVEVDIYLTKDNKVIAIHDKDTKRTCLGEDNYVIKDTPSEVLRELDAGAWKDEKYRGEKIPFLSEIIETIPEGKELVVEIKSGSEVLPYLKEVVEASGKKEQIVFIAFDWETILETKNVFPDNKCYWLSSVKEGLEEKMEQAADAGLEGINLNYKIVDKELVEKAQEYNLEVLVWTVNDPEIAMEMKQAGVVAITTDRPKWLKEEMEKL
jgi:glycerophosphoryl diester phosphodiesterase